jgi:hypothetical protein
MEDLPWLGIFRVLSYSLLGIGLFLFLSVAVFSILLKITKISVKIKVHLFHLRFFGLSFGVISIALFFISALITTAMTDSLLEKRVLLGLLTIVAVSYVVLWLWVRHSSRVKSAERQTKDREENR